MHEIRIIGKEKVDYISKKTQAPVKGVSLHCVGTRGYVEGESVETIFVSAKSSLYDKIPQIPIGAKCNIAYNRYGSADYIEVEE